MKAVSEAERWTTRVADDDAGRAGALLRHALQPAPLGDDELAALGARLAREGRAVARTRSPARRLAVALALMVLGGALTAAAARLTGWLAPPTARPSVAPAPVAPPRPAPHAASVPAPAPTPAIAPDLAAPEPPPPRHAAAAPPPAAAPEPPSPLAEESKLLELALRKLRRENDPQAALTLLDERDARFAAAGALGAEAGLARIEALVQMRRHKEALALLEPMALPPSGRTRELLATRAELRAAAGRCGEALVDFDALLADGDRTDLVAERALFGRAACRARSGDAAGARADLESYLARFPAGRFAVQAAEALVL